MAQNNPADPLGVREEETSRLEEAVAAYRDALQENTRARVPLDWARPFPPLTRVNSYGFRRIDSARERIYGAWRRR